MSDLRIWIIDDSRTEAAMTQQALGPGYTCEMFMDGSVAIERLAAGEPQPDAILVDWVMPGMCGDELCRYLRSNPATAELPLILVTASRIETEDVVAGLSAGANDYLARPFAVEELRARVQSAIRIRRISMLAEHRSRRLAAINDFARAVFAARGDVGHILDTLATTLTRHICDGCAVMLLPGELPPTAIARHRIAAREPLLAAIGAFADPGVHAFPTPAAARESLSPLYHAYVDACGLRSLAILPFPVLAELQGVVTVTRDRGDAFDADDIKMIETCIEYAAVAVQNAQRLDLERAARAQLHAVLENLPLGVFVYDGNRTLAFTNAAAKRLLPGAAVGMSLDEARSTAQWTRLDGGPATGDDMWTGTDDTLYREVRLERPGDPTARIVTAASVRLRNVHGVITHVVIVLQDVTHERTITTEREQMAQFQRQLLGIVSHDLRNPLGAFVLGLGVLAQRTSDVPAAAPIILRLESNARQMTRIVDQLLDVTRASMGTGVPIEPRETPLRAVVNSVLEQVALTHPDAAFEVSGPTEVVGFWDPERLAQVFSNLVTNAVNYGRPGAPVTIEISREPDEAKIEVRNAIREAPIPKAQLEALFEPHRRGDDGRRTKTGLGLGLYIVREIVRSHHGQVVAESDPTGTTFRVLLPLGSRRPS